MDPTANDDGGGREIDFDRLFRAEYGRVVAVAQRVLGDRVEAEDVAQEVFIDFHRRHPARAGFAAAWLHTAAAHSALNRIRGRRRRERRELAESRRDVRPEQDPGRLLEERMDRERVRRALARLPERSASILALRYSGLSYAEVGAALGLSPGSVGTLLRRAEIRLRQEMGDATP